MRQSGRNALERDEVDHFGLVQMLAHLAGMESYIRIFDAPGWHPRDKFAEACCLRVALPFPKSDAVKLRLRISPIRSL